MPLGLRCNTTAPWYKHIVWYSRPWLQDATDRNTLCGIADHGCKILEAQIQCMELQAMTTRCYSSQERSRRSHTVTHMHHVTGVQLLETSPQLTHNSTGCDFRNSLAAPNVPGQVSSCTVLHDQVQVVGCLHVIKWIWQSLRFYSALTCCS